MAGDGGGRRETAGNIGKQPKTAGDGGDDRGRRGTAGDDTIGGFRSTKLGTAIAVTTVFTIATSELGKTGISEILQELV